MVNPSASSTLAQFIIPGAPASSKPRGRKPHHPTLLEAWLLQQEASAMGVAFDREKYLKSKGFKPGDNVVESVNKTKAHVLTAPPPLLVEDDSEEDDATTIVRISSRFNIMGKLLESVCLGNIRLLIVSGAGGVGKTFKAESVLAHYREKDDITTATTSGYRTPIMLYEFLWKYRHPNCVILFDDSDAILGDETSVNLLKAATDTKPVRKVSYGSASKMLEEQGIPLDFEFEAQIIFLTNLDFEGYIKTGRAPKLTPHLQALMTRGTYLDLEIHSLREVGLWIDHQVRKHKILITQHGLTVEQQETILEWLADNRLRLRFPSIRTAVKAAGHMTMNPKGWKAVMEATEISKGM